ncbi:MAG TPA: glutamine--fructose-6-phosphate transaminase (isomerizing) [Thermoanaerobaculaceae bacterium]|nr:glutamine--fructose-6-phosphate transaminase (isomerizing) [Thermoanaerobaculaceae bacterium]HRS15910.1 glutamine--fructose-6-phosphate transaminase (isomerizing) [Thermoanaerobaculaceae bacterium]
MCGIVGYVGPREAVPVVLEALRHLEYRGYDSAGLAVHLGSGIEVLRAPGKLINLVEKAYRAGLASHLALGHTRWATHGAPTERNAHPHTDEGGRVAVVHNGIIENFRELRAELEARGTRFSSDTDSEVIAHLLAAHGADLASAALALRPRLRGQYAVAAVSRSDPRTIVAFRNGPPLVIGMGEAENLVASDPAAVLAVTRHCLHLEDGDLAVIRADSVQVLDAAGRPVARAVTHLDWEPGEVERGGFRHFMLKEIHEQPAAVGETLHALLPDPAVPSLAHLGLGAETLQRFREVRLVACGTSWHAALVGKFYLERLARVRCEVDYASEFRYREPLLDPATLVIGITQSGETADTIAALQLARASGCTLAAVCNVRGAHAERLADFRLPTHAGPEIGVASTKAFTTQLAALLALALAWRAARGLETPGTSGLAERAGALPYDLEGALRVAPQVAAVAAELEHASDALYLGRGVLYPLALEGALKLKEISYLHAEGYPAGEMKHGPIALLDENFPVIALCPPGELEDKVRSNIEEVRARRAPVYVLGDAEDARLGSLARQVIPLQPLPWPLQPIVAAVPLQLLAYEVAVRRGCDVDQPRNLAKSVTVE